MALKAMKANALVGSAKTVAHKLQDLADRLGLEELVVITWTHDPQAQVHSYSLLAQEFNLKP
jgi:alkanesulfonate monooxygenase SsuD/methylene tetrahydromethanopterin reductase-like flavin-dependent oxidoreductase (luciferase family)